MSYDMNTSGNGQSHYGANTGTAYMHAEPESGYVPHQMDGPEDFTIPLIDYDSIQETGHNPLTGEPKPEETAQRSPLELKCAPEPSTSPSSVEGSRLNELTSKGSGDEKKGTDLEALNEMLRRMMEEVKRLY